MQPRMILETLRPLVPSLQLLLAKAGNNSKIEANDQPCVFHTCSRIGSLQTIMMTVLLIDLGVVYNDRRDNDIHTTCITLILSLHFDGS